MREPLDRRDLLGLASSALVGLAAPAACFAGQPEGDRNAPRRGCVAGHPEGAQAGMDILAAGGNAVDAAVAAALVAGVVAIHHCGPGGYGGHLIIARGDGKRVIAVDFNSAAPRAARPDMFPVDSQGRVKGGINNHGWLAAGVPGTLAGLQLALDRHGTLPFRQVVQPAIRFAREGFPLSAAVAGVIRTARGQFARDPGSAHLLLPGGEPAQAGARFRNPDLAALLENLAKDNSVDSFYRGDIARRIAAAFHKQGGLVTAEDLAAYRAREVEPLELSWRGHSIRTAPLTAGGLTVLEVLAILKALNWEKRDPRDPRTTHLRLEALRLAWEDRLRLLGDPERAEVPSRRLLSEDYARKAAGQIEEAVRKGRPLRRQADGRPDAGTTHISAADGQGTMVALTLTHGGSFGAQVTVDGLGLILGHGMSRFDPRPGRPNSVAPGKRPLHNMCPTVVLKDGRPVLALGARGGRRIPNAVFEVLVGHLGRGLSLEEAVAAPRMHTEGDLRLTVQRGWPEVDVNYLRKVGYTVAQGAHAILHAVAFDPKTGACRSAGR
jgi:gamma-glutamyltranspeptidase/glutathione hydrolase